MTALHRNVKTSSITNIAQNSTCHIIYSHFTQLSKIKNIPNYISHRNKHRKLCYSCKKINIHYSLPINDQTVTHYIKLYSKHHSTLNFVQFAILCSLYETNHSLHIKGYKENINLLYNKIQTKNLIRT